MEHTSEDEEVVIRLTVDGFIHRDGRSALILRNIIRIYRLLQPDQ